MTFHVVFLFSCRNCQVVIKKNMNLLLAPSRWTLEKAQEKKGRKNIDLLCASTWFVVAVLFVATSRRNQSESKSSAMRPSWTRFSRRLRYRWPSTDLYETRARDYESTGQSSDAKRERGGAPGAFRSAATRSFFSSLLHRITDLLRGRVHLLLHHPSAFGS